MAHRIYCLYCCANNDNFTTMTNTKLPTPLVLLLLLPLVRSKAGVSWCIQMLLWFVNLVEFNCKTCEAVIHISIDCCCTWAHTNNMNIQTHLQWHTNISSNLDLVVSSGSSSYLSYDCIAATSLFCLQFIINYSCCRLWWETISWPA